MVDCEALNALRKERDELRDDRDRWRICSSEWVAKATKLEVERNSSARALAEERGAVELVASQTAESEAYDKLAEARKTIKWLRKKLVAAYNQRDEARKVAECPFPFKRRTECESDVRQLQQTRSLRSATPKGEGT